MYLIGHCWITEISRLFSEEDLYGDGLPLLMVPDYAGCHEWAYAESWTARTHEMRLVQAHALADWYVHYGDTWSVERKKTGWAYLKMRPATRTYRDFYGEAESLGLRDPNKPRSSVRGFAHSMLEYSVDTHIARKGLVDDKFDRIKDALRCLEDASYVRAMVDRLGVTGSLVEVEPNAVLYLDQTLWSMAPEEVVYYFAARKFGLLPGQESMEYVRRYQEWILSTLDPDELDGLSFAVAEAMADPATFNYVNENFCLTTPVEES